MRIAPADRVGPYLTLSVWGMPMKKCWAGRCNSAKNLSAAREDKAAGWAVKYDEYTQNSMSTCLRPTTGYIEGRSIK
jgi:hypothetical protein